MWLVTSCELVDFIGHILSAFVVGLDSVRTVFVRVVGLLSYVDSLGPADSTKKNCISFFAGD